MCWRFPWGLIIFVLNAVSSGNSDMPAPYRYISLTKRFILKVDESGKTTEAQGSRNVWGLPFMASAHTPPRAENIPDVAALFKEKGVSMDELNDLEPIR